VLGPLLILTVTLLWPRVSAAKADVVPAAPSVPASRPGHVLQELKVELAYQDRNVLRSGPGEGYSLVGVYPRGAVFPVIAKSGEWYNVRLSGNRTGWVHGSLCRTKEDLSHLEFRPNPKMFSRVGSFVLTGNLGGYAFDRKSNSVAFGGRLGYYLLDFVQVEAGITWTRVVRPAEIVENLFDLRLEEENFPMLFYDLDLVLELLPGRQIVPYVVGGGGSAIFQGKAEPGFNLGGGTTVYLGRTTSLRLELRNYRFRSGSQGGRRTNSNFQFVLGTSVLL